MDETILRERLHQYIDIADTQHLTAIYDMVEDEIGTDDIYDEATLKILDKRRENHLKGVSKSYTSEESIKRILQHKK